MKKKHKGKVEGKVERDLWFERGVVVLEGKMIDMAHLREHWGLDDTQTANLVAAHVTLCLRRNMEMTSSLLAAFVRLTNGRFLPGERFPENDGFVNGALLTTCGTLGIDLGCVDPYETALVLRQIGRAHAKTVVIEPPSFKRTRKAVVKSMQLT